MTTQKVIAERLGVSQRLVAYALSGKGRMRDATRQRIRREAGRLGYRPNRAARALATGRSHMVAMWMPRLMSPFYAKVAQTFELLLQPTDYDLVIAGRTGARPEEESEILPVDWMLDGLLAVEAETAVRQWAPRAPLLPPLVSVGAYARDFSGDLDFVSVDLEPSAAAAIEHLLTLGCRRIAYLAEDTMFADFEPRYRGVTRALRKAGRRMEGIRVPSEPRLRPAAHRVLLDYVAKHGCPDGLFCGNDDTAIGAYRALRDLGRRVPDDVALIGCDGIEDAEYFDCPLSTIVQPTDVVCAKAWEFLLARMNRPDLPPQQIEYTAELVIRASTRGVGNQRRQLEEVHR